MTARDQFLQRVREAVAAGNRAGHLSALEPRGQVGYQGAGPEPIGRFCTEFTAAGGQPHLVADLATARARVLELVRARAPQRVLLGGGPLLERLELASGLTALQIATTIAVSTPADTCREPFFAAEVGITGVDYLVAETGSMVFLARPGEARSLSLLPPVHIAVAAVAQLLPDLFDLFALLPAVEMPSGLAIVTGPSKTGDIELRLVTGVHGPGEVHLVLVTDPVQPS